MKRMQSAVSRRHTLKLIAVGMSASVATELFAKDTGKISAKTLQGAAGLVDGDFNDKRLDMVGPALQRNMDQFAIVRQLDIDDLIEPTPNFYAGWS